MLAVLKLMIFLLLYPKGGGLWAHVLSDIISTLLFNIYDVYIYLNVHTRVWCSEDTFQELVLSNHHVGSRGSSVVRLSSRCLYPLGHLDSSRIDEVNRGGKGEGRGSRQPDVLVYN